MLLIGLAYKANVDDMRESPTFVLMDDLTRRGAVVEYYDSYIPIVTPTREHDKWTGKKSIAWGEGEITGFDAVVVATAHDNVDYRQLAAWAQLIVDTRNVMNTIPCRPGQLWKA